MVRASLFLIIAALFIGSGCARLHKVKVGNIDNRIKGKKFNVKVSEVGVNLERTGEALSRFSKNDDFNKGAEYLGMIQMGPKTGNPIYNVSEFLNIHDKIKSKCPSMRITGLTSIREMRNYDFVSGEIVKITGYCK